MENKCNEETITSFLMDGDDKGRIKCSIGSADTVFYKIPRRMLSNCEDGTQDIVKHLKQVGIYFLLGQDITNHENVIYIGQSTEIIKRLKQHEYNKNEKYHDDWNEIFVITTKDNSWGNTELHYLENYFTILAKDAKRFNVKNGNDPNRGNITEEKKSTLNTYVRNSCIVVGLLGYKVFEPEDKKLINNQQISSNIETSTPINKENVSLIKTEQTINKNKQDNNNIFYFKYKSLNAYARWIDNKFVVLKGSEISQTFTDSAPIKRIKEQRQEYSDYIDSNYILLQDISFNSASTAAEFVAGASLNGNDVWKTNDNKSPNDIKDLLVQNKECILQNDNTNFNTTNFTNKEVIFRFKFRNLLAQGKWKNNKFVVLKRSQISPMLTPTAYKYKIDQIRKEYADKIDNNILKEDIEFNSASSAANFVGGHVFNGNDAWKTDDNKSPNEVKKLAIENKEEIIQITKDNLELNNSINCSNLQNHNYEKIFIFQSKSIKAYGKLTNEGFLVLKGSEISKTLHPSADEFTKNFREINKNNIDENYILLKDILFNSSSSAAKFVGGSSLSGNKYWKTDDEKSPKDIKNNN